MQQASTFPFAWILVELKEKKKQTRGRCNTKAIPGCLLLFVTCLVLQKFQYRLMWSLTREQLDEKQIRVYAPRPHPRPRTVILLPLDEENMHLTCMWSMEK